MSRKTKSIWCGAALGLAFVVGLFAIYLMRDRGPIRYENFVQIKKGMTLAEVEQLLACKAGNHATGSIELELEIEGRRFFVENPELVAGVYPLGFGMGHVWHGDNGVITVEFDNDSTCLEMNYHPGRRMRPPWWSAMERWLIGL